MQHQHGKPLHRTTEWRRLKRGFNSRKGRRWTSEFQGEGFIGFTATVISLINKNGRVGYGELFDYKPIPTGGGILSYAKTEETDAIFKKLANSGFPPEMIAVAGGLLGKLNKKNRRGAKPTHLMPHELAFNDLINSGLPINRNNYNKFLRKHKFDAALKQTKVKKSDRQLQIIEAEKSNFTADWVLETIRSYKTPVDKRCHGQAPVAVSSKSTPAHKIEFRNGAELSRNMVYYWKKHNRFGDCIRFLGTMLTRPRPVAPTGDFFAMAPDYYINGEIEMLFKVRKLENEEASRLGGKTTRADSQQTA